MDNAVACIQTTTNNRKCSVYMRYNKSIFTLEISNTFHGKIKEEKGKIFTSKKDKENYGLGIESVRAMLKRYHGDLEIEYDEKCFTATVYIYTESI